MAGEGLSVSTPTEVRPPSSAGPAGIGLSSQNASVAALNAPRPPTESGPAADCAESRLSPKWTFTQLGSALESDSLPENTQPSPTHAASDSSGSDDYDPGYTDNDDLCETCQFLLEPGPVCEGWEVEFHGKQPEFTFPIWILTTKITWSDNLMTSLFADYCPLCYELRWNMRRIDNELFQQQPTQDEITVVKQCEYRPNWNCFGIKLTVKTKSVDQFGLPVTMYARTEIYPESGMYHVEST